MTTYAKRWDFFGNLPVGALFEHPELGIEMVKCADAQAEICPGVPYRYNCHPFDGSKFVQRRLSGNVGVCQFIEVNREPASTPHPSEGK